MPCPQGFILYRFWYGSEIVYVGRTKQPLDRRMHGHFFGAAMHRKIEISRVSKFEYTMLESEADMNLYEIFYILKLKPTLNRDDKAADDLTIALPELDWTEYRPAIWEKWRKENEELNASIKELLDKYRSIPEYQSALRKRYRAGEIGVEEFDREMARSKAEQARLRTKLYG